MEEITTVGLDIAKSVFQVHAISEAGEVVVRRQLKRRQVLQFFAAMKPCLIGMEACATAHHWARELIKLGHEVRLMPPRYVKPYVKRNKNDAADAEAICEAVSRPTIRFVPVKTVDQQSVLMLHRTRQLFIRQRTTLINSIRAHLAEFGIVAGIGRNGVEALLTVIVKGEEQGVPPEAQSCLMALAEQLELVKRQILEMNRRVLAWHRASSLSRSLEGIPGVGPLISTALVALRIFAAIAWIIAIGGEIYGVWLVYHHAFDQGGQPLLLGILISIAVFAIAGNLLWKAANRNDPARASDTARFFFQNQLGAIISLIAFCRLILIFTDKDMDPRTKGVATSVGAVLVVLATVLGISVKPPSVEQYTQDMNTCAAQIKAGQPTTARSPDVAVQAQAIAKDSSTVADATKDAAHPDGQDVVYWIAPENGQAKSDTPHVFHLCAGVSPLKDKTVNSGSVTKAYAQNAVRITEQIAMEQKQCGFSAPSNSSSASSS